jgi:ADP-ribose pyrophosphatase YjhB (NUDIX family)
MELIKELILPEEWTGLQKTREACRAVIFDENNMMPLIFVAKENYHKLPGWWIETGEDKIMALTRELKEETWCEAKISKEIWIVIESNSTRKQISYCYIGTIIKKSEHNFTDGEKEKWYELQRVTIDEAIQLIKSDISKGETSKRILPRDLSILEKAKEMI